MEIGFRTNDAEIRGTNVSGTSKIFKRRERKRGRGGGGTGVERSVSRKSAFTRR